MQYACLRIWDRGSRRRGSISTQIVTKTGFVRNGRGRRGCAIRACPDRVSCSVLTYCSGGEKCNEKYQAEPDCFFLNHVFLLSKDFRPMCMGLGPAVSLSAAAECLGTSRALLGFPSRFRSRSSRATYGRQNWQDFDGVAGPPYRPADRKGDCAELLKTIRAGHSCRSFLPNQRKTMA